jgi:tetratricopeptide (TPR) repeat protein
LQAEGEFALVIENLESALDLSGQPVKRGTMAHEHIVAMMLAEAAAQLEDASALRRYGSLLETLTLRDGHQPYLAVAHRAWGIACTLDGEYGEAEARFNQALDLFTELDFPWQLGRTRTEMARLAEARSQPERARHHLEAALSQFESLGAKPELEQTRAALEAIGVA